MGTHVPLFALLIYTLMSAQDGGADKVHLLLIAIGATLAGSMVTLVALNQLLRPVILTHESLRKYLELQRLPQLPSNYTDEAGRLMADTSFVIGQLDEAIHRLSNFDTNTDLPNRRMLVHCIGELSSGCLAEGATLAVISIEISGLDSIGVRLGRDAQANATVTTARRLAEVAGDGSMVGRTSDTTFAIVTSSPQNRAELMSLAGRVMDALTIPILTEGSSFPLKGVIGIANYPEDATDPEILLSYSESAVLAAKKTAGHEIACFTRKVNDALIQQLELEVDLLHALDNGELTVLYQPIVDAREGRITGSEALLRWQRSNGESIDPLEFIPIAESNGAICDIGLWVIREACHHVSAWHDRGDTDYRISVNLSAVQLRQANFVDSVFGILRETGVNPTSLQLEITESAIVENSSIAITTLRALRKLGITIALDDFGTGYSSLSQLKQLPIDVVKIDRSFVMGLPRDAKDFAIVKAVIAFAKSLRLGVVGEGVETIEQRNCLLEGGCDKMQGFLFSPPLTSQSLDELPIDERLGAFA